MLPGFSLHLELQRFVAAGFTPMQALQTATIDPAKFLDKLNDFGTVEKGKIADLVLLNANPLDDIANSQKIAAVFSNGRYYSRAQLDGILADIQPTLPRTNQPQSGRPRYSKSPKGVQVSLNGRCFAHSA